METDSLKFHIESQDYFGTLATRLSLIRQLTKDNNFDNLENIEKELVYLQENYRIYKK